MNKLNSLVVAAALGAGLAVSAAPALQAAELHPLQAKQVTVGELHGVAYYTVKGPVYHLVATLAGEDGKPMRVESNLAAGQSLVVSTPDRIGGVSKTVAFVRQGDRIVVEAGAPPVD